MPTISLKNDFTKEQAQSILSSSQNNKLEPVARDALVSKFASKILGRDVSYNDITVDDVRNLYKNTMITLGQMNRIEINEKNCKDMLDKSLLSMASTMNPKAELHAFTTVDNQPIDVDYNSYFNLDNEAQPLPQPKKPNIFKRAMYKMFGAFENECKPYYSFDFSASEQFNKLGVQASTVNKKNKDMHDLSRRLVELNSTEKERESARKNSNSIDYNELVNENSNSPKKLTPKARTTEKTLDKDKTL